MQHYRQLKSWTPLLLKRIDQKYLKKCRARYIFRYSTRQPWPFLVGPLVLNMCCEKRLSHTSKVRDLVSTHMSMKSENATHAIFLHFATCSNSRLYRNSMKQYANCVLSLLHVVVYELYEIGSNQPQKCEVSESAWFHVSKRKWLWILGAVANISRSDDGKAQKVGTPNLTMVSHRSQDFCRFRRSHPNSPRFRDGISPKVAAALLFLPHRSVCRAHGGIIWDGTVAMAGIANAKAVWGSADLAKNGEHFAVWT